MPVVIERPTLASRFFFLWRGFDLPLLVAVGLLALLGLVTMYSSGFAHGERFWDQARNLLIAATVMLVVAQIPPQKLLNLAVPLYVIGVVLLIAVALFGITKKGATRWINVGAVRSITMRDRPGANRPHVRLVAHPTRPMPTPLPSPRNRPPPDRSSAR